MCARKMIKPNEKRRRVPIFQIGKYGRNLQIACLFGDTAWTPPETQRHASTSTFFASLNNFADTVFKPVL
jgi:hypothetical protein